MTAITVADVLAGVVRSVKQGVIGFIWDVAAARYRNRATGRFVPEKQIFEAAEGYAQYATANIDRITTRLMNGSIDVAEWQRLVADEVKNARLVSSMAGRGGRYSMTQADFGRVGGRLQFDYRRLDDFAQQVANGELSEAQIRARASLYGSSATESYNDGVVAATEDAGLRLMFQLGATERHCSDCLRLDGQVHSAAAWMASDMKPQSYALECHGFRCDCRLVPTDAEENGSF